MPESASPILIVEDNETNAMILRAMLRRQGYEAQVATDGHEGVEMTRLLNPPLILMDLHMPRLDGFAAAAAIRKLVNGDAPIIVAVTANVSPDMQAACLAAGFAAVLPKPVMLDSLIATVRLYLPPPS